MNAHAHADADPMSLVNRLDAEMEAVMSRCEECGAVPTVTPALGSRYVLGLDHEPTCPWYLDDDDLPCVVVQPRLPGR